MEGGDFHICYENVRSSCYYDFLSKEYAGAEPPYELMLECISCLLSYVINVFQKEESILKKEDAIGTLVTTLLKAIQLVNICIQVFLPLISAVVRRRYFVWLLLQLV